MCRTTLLSHKSHKLLTYSPSNLIFQGQCEFCRALEGTWAVFFFFFFCGNHHFQPFSKNPLYQPASFCQTIWWSPFLTSSLLRDQPESRISPAQQSTKAPPPKEIEDPRVCCVCARVFVCLLDVPSIWRACIKTQLTAGDAEGLNSCLNLAFRFGHIFWAETGYYYDALWIHASH